MENSYACLWGRYSGLVGHTNGIHSEDIEFFSTIDSARQLGKCMGVSDGFLSVLYQPNVYVRMAHAYFKVFPTPQFSIGDIVIFEDKEAIVCKVFWHFKEEKHIYILQKGNRISGRWYFEDGITRSY